MKTSSLLTASAVLAFGLAAQAAPSPAEVPLPKWSQGTWADNKFATCAELNSPTGFKDGGFITISGSEMGGHEWGCKAVRKTGKGEFDFDCGGEGEEFKAHGRLQKAGNGMVIRWQYFGESDPKYNTWRYAAWCRMGPPAFWGN